MTDVSEAIDVASTAMVRVPEPASIVRQTVATEEVVAAQNAYHDLCSKLLDKSDYQRIGDKDFRKKSGWRKLAVAFNVSVELLTKEYERDERGRIVRAEIVARATAPNGRTMDGLGACDLFEKCCPAATGGKCKRGHNHCVSGCTGSTHFSNPQHDLPATAHTRAVNRACADLFGMGEVSAEEMSAGGGGQHVDERDWFAENGWRDEATARKAMSDKLAELKKLPEDVRTDLKAWMAKQDPPIDPTKLWTKPQFDAVAGYLAPPQAAQTSQDGAGDAERAQGGQDATEGDSAAQSARAQATAEHKERMAEVAAEANIGQPIVDAIHDLVKRLNAKGVDDKLTELRLHCEGHIDERRRRLELALLMKEATEHTKA